jgi:hypothetical protein
LRRSERPTRLKTSSVQIKNLSQKTIDGVWITLQFPESSISNYIEIGSATTRLGHPSGKDAVEVSPAFRLGQGQMMDIPLGANYESTRPVRERQHPSETAVAKLRVEMVFFSDGTAWAQRAYLRPDPDHPSKFIRICAGDFYKYSDPR